MKKILLIGLMLLSFAAPAFADSHDINDYTELNDHIFNASDNDLLLILNNITVNAPVNPVNVTGLSILGNHYIFDGNGYSGFSVLAGKSLSVNFGNSTDSAIKNFTLTAANPQGSFATNNGGTLSINNSCFLNNTSTDTSFTNRGGLIAHQVSGSMSVTNSTVQSNSIVLNNVVNDTTIAGGLFKTDTGNFTFTNNLVSNNSVSLSPDPMAAPVPALFVQGGLFNFSSTTALLSGVSITGTNITSNTVYGGIINSNTSDLTFNSSIGTSSITNSNINSDNVILGGLFTSVLAGFSDFSYLSMNNNNIGSDSTPNVFGGLIGDDSVTFSWTNSTATGNRVLGGTISGGLIRSSASDSTTLSSLTLTSNTIGNASTNSIVGGLINDDSTNSFTLSNSTIGSATNAALKNTITATSIDGAILKTDAQTVNITNSTIGNNVVNATNVNALIKIGPTANNATISGNTITRNTINAVNNLSGGILSSNSTNLAISSTAITYNNLTSSNGNIQGGVISSSGTTTLGGNSSISNNTITATNGDVLGGVFYNGAGANLGFSSTTIANNVVTAGNDIKGGVVHNNGGTVTISSSNLQGITSNATNNALGGVIYNDNGGTVTLNNTSLVNNRANGATALGGAVYNDGGTININSTGTAVSISGNQANGVSNGIYTNGGILGFNSGTGSITVSDKIVSQDNTTVMNISGTTGSLILNTDMRDFIGTVNFSGGTLRLNSSAYFFNPLATNILGSGVFNFKNSQIDLNNTGDYTAAAGTTLTMHIDAGLSGAGQIDHFNMNSATVDPTSSVSLSSMRLLSDLADLLTPMSLELANYNVNTVIDNGSRAKLIFTPVSRYDMSIDNTLGTDKIVFTSAGAGSGGLKNALVSTDNLGIRDLDLTTNDVVDAWDNGNILLGTSLVIDGQNRNITTVNSLPGIVTNTNNQLIINDVAQWSGFNSQYGGAIYNDGASITVSNSTFRNNTARRGGALYQNSGTLSFSGTITNNSATGAVGENAQGGGAYIASGQSATIGGTISSNSATSDDAQGGGIYAASGSTVSLGNVSSNSAVGINAQGGGVFVDDGAQVTAGSVSSNNATGSNAKGGGIYVSPTAQASVTTLSSNTATGDNAQGGGAYNDNILTVTGSIQNNKAIGTNAKGGAIYNNGGTVNVNANSGAITISGNTAGETVGTATSNSIYSDAGILNFNGGIYGINLNDKIFSTAATVLNTTGIVNLNTNLTDYIGAVSLKGGTVTLGTSGTFFNPLSTTVTANTIFDSRNNKIDTTSFGAFDITGGSVLSLRLDADLNAKTIDSITSSSGITPVGSVVITEVKILTENQSNPPESTFNIPFANVGLNSSITSSTIFSNNYKYDVSVNADTQSLDFVVKNIFNGLPEAVQYYHDIGQTNYPRFYATADVDVTAWLNPLNGNVQQDSYIYIDGQQRSITTSTGVKGIVIGAGRAMEMVNVGSWTNNSDGSITVNKSWSAFRNTNGAALNNQGGTLSITDSAFTNNVATAAGGTIYNAVSGTMTLTDSVITTSTAGTDGGAIYNSSSTATITGSTISQNQATGNGGAIYSSSSPTTISNSTLVSNQAGGTGGAIYNSGSTMSITNSTISNNTSVGNGGAIFNSGTLTLTDTSLLNNKTTGAGTKGGAVYNSGSMTVNATNQNVSFSGNTIANSTTKNAIYLDGGSLTLNTGTKSITFGDSILSKDSTSTMAINSTAVDSDGNPAGVVNINADMSSYTGTLALSGATLNLGSGLAGTNLLNLSGLTISNNPVINTQNGRTQDSNLGAVTYNSDYKVNVDVDLASARMDRFLATSLTNPGGYNLFVDNMRILTPTTNMVTRINFVNNALKDNVTSNVINIVYSPIYKYNLSYEQASGDFVFNYSGFSPNVYSGAASALVGGYLNQLNTYDQVFTNMEMFMYLPQKERMAILNANKVASADTNSYNYLINHDSTKGMWYRPFSTFENVPLNNGPRVSNIGYGSFVGGDTEMVSLGHGFDGLISVYAGYNGSHQNYNGVSMNQCGGTLGVTGTVYKGNFFGGMTLNIGANSGEAFSMFGKDNFTLLTSGVAIRTGYNFEMLKGKLILQPNYMMAYSFVNTFDYTTATGVNISSNPMNIIHIEPGVRLIANCKNGWQPYLGVSMAWNIMDQTQFYANDVALPDLSIRPYVKYGLGVQKTWGERLTGFAQAFFTNGGRNGVGLQLALRWSF